MNRIPALAVALAAATLLGTALPAQAQWIGRSGGLPSRLTPDCCRKGICAFHAGLNRDRGRDRHDDDRYGRHGRHGRRGDVRVLRRTAVSLETATDRFVRTFDRGLDRSRLNGSRREDVLNEHAKRLERAADRFKDRVHDGRVNDRLVDELFDSAAVLERFMDRARLDRRAERDWLRVEHELVEIARYFGIRSWRDGHGDRGRDRGRWDDRGRDGRGDRWDDDRDDHRDGRHGRRGRGR